MKKISLFVTFILLSQFVWAQKDTPKTYRFSLDEAIKSCSANEEIYIIGGSSVYQQAMEIADRLCLTLIDDTPTEADAFFPDYEKWKECERENHTKDEKHDYDYAFVDFIRK